MGKNELVKFFFELHKEEKYTNVEYSINFDGRKLSSLIAFDLAIVINELRQANFRILLRVYSLVI